MPDLTNAENNLMNKVVEEASFEKEISDDDSMTLSDYIKKIVSKLNPFEKNIYDSAINKIKE